MLKKAIQTTFFGRHFAGDQPHGEQTLGGAEDEQTCQKQSAVHVVALEEEQQRSGQSCPPLGVPSRA